MSFKKARLVLCIVLLLPFSLAEAMEKEVKQPEKVFKIGFEFQESSNLCPWAKGNYNIQKKPFFYCLNKNGEKLWRIEIDGSDIEFVTEPFTNNQLEDLKQAIEGILEASSSLTSKKKSVSTIGEYLNKISIALLDKGYCTSIPDEDLLTSIKDNKITLRTKLFFEPQATIQYPVGYSIPLWFSLFGFEVNSSVFTKFKEVIANFQKEELLNKNSGLIFLHALTLYNIAPSNSDDYNLLYETLDRIDRGQADAKGLLYLMSRRPFSSMWQDINQCSLDYPELFNEKMGSNGFFEHVKNNFYKTNYAEEYLDKNNIIRKDLKNIILSLLNDDFYGENDYTIDQLLSKGLISTTMIRNFKNQDATNIFNDYYVNSIKSVQDPTEFRRYVFDVNKKEIMLAQSAYDILSPPHFLDIKDAMGYYNEDNKIDIDKDFGEAIIEARQIKKVGEYFLAKKELKGRRGIFLTEPVPNEIFINEITSLFDFVNSVLDKNKNKTVLFELIEKSGI